jgi:hypothetical protein
MNMKIWSCHLEPSMALRMRFGLSSGQIDVAAGGEDENDGDSLSEAAVGDAMAEVGTAVVSSLGTSGCWC